MRFDGGKPQLDALSHLAPIGLIKPICASNARHLHGEAESVVHLEARGRMTPSPSCTISGARGAERGWGPALIPEACVDASLDDGGGS